MIKYFPCPHDITVEESQAGMGRFFSLSNLDRYRILASDAVGVAERKQVLKVLAKEMNTFRRECHAVTVRERT